MQEEMRSLRNTSTVRKRGALKQSTSYGAMRIRYKGSRPSLISVLSRTPLGKTYKERPHQCPSGLK
jgi:hypothetical protein